MQELICDICGEPSESLMRIALDRDYDRLTVAHKVLYACHQCSLTKSQERLGMG